MRFETSSQEMQATPRYLVRTSTINRFLSEFTQHVSSFQRLRSRECRTERSSHVSRDKFRNDTGLGNDQERVRESREKIVSVLHVFMFSLSLVQYP